MRPLALVVLLLASGCAPAPATTPGTPVAVTARVAREMVGRTAAVTGEVEQVKTAAHHGFAYLNFGGRFPDHAFAVLIPDSVVTRFGDLMRYEGRRARATGVVWLQESKWPAMTLTDPAALELLP